MPSHQPATRPNTDEQLIHHTMLQSLRKYSTALLLLAPLLSGMSIDVQLGNITAMLTKIKPAVEQTSDGFEGEATSANDTFVTGVVNNNVLHTIGQIRERSPIIAELEQNGDVVIAGAFYDLETGRVTMLD